MSRTHRRALFAAFAALLSVSCVEPGPAGPALGLDAVGKQGATDDGAHGHLTSGSGSPDAGAPHDLGRIARFVGSAPATPALVTASIGPEGGTLSLGDWEVVVPPGAVSSNTLFMIRRPMDSKLREYDLVELRPHNTTFLVPVTLRMPLDGTSAGGDATSAVSAWDDVGALWNDAPSQVIEAGARIEAQVIHFSWWGVSFLGEMSSGGQ